MKLEDLPKKQPFQMPDEAHFDTISSRIYAQLEKEEVEKQEKEQQKSSTKSISITSLFSSPSSDHWTKSPFVKIAATLLLLFIAVAGIYSYSSKNTSTKQQLAVETQTSKKLDFSKISTQQITDFLLEEDISETELVSILPPNSTLNIPSMLEDTNLNSMDNEALDILLEEEYF